MSLSERCCGRNRGAVLRRDTTRRTLSHTSFGVQHSDRSLGLTVITLSGRICTDDRSRVVPLSQETFPGCALSGVKNKTKWKGKRQKVRKREKENGSGQKRNIHREKPRPAAKGESVSLGGALMLSAENYSAAGFPHAPIISSPERSCSRIYHYMSYKARASATRRSAGGIGR